MRKIFTLSILLLLSFTAMVNVQAQSLPEFTAEGAGDAASHWYYVRFVRAWNMQKRVWAKSDTTLEVRQEVMRPDDRRQHWKFVGNESSCYIVNRFSGEKMLYSGTSLSEGAPEGVRADKYFFTDGNIHMTGRVDYSSFLFVEYGGTTADYLNTVMLRDIEINSMVNDQARATICTYNGGGGNDAGNPISWVSINDKDLAASSDSIFIETLIGSTERNTVTISSFNLSSVDVAVSGPDAAAFTLSATTLTPGTDGAATLNIDFTPTEAREYSALLTLSSEGISKTVKLAGLGIGESDLPRISEGADEYWYYIRFYRQPGKVWSLADDTVRQKTQSGDAALWKIEGDWENGYYFINKVDSREIKYTVNSANAGRYVEAPAEMGEAFRFVHFKASTGLTADWQLFNLSYTPATPTTSKYVNDSQGTQLTNYSKDDAGNRLVFIPADTKDILINATSIDFKVFEIEGDTTVSKVYALAGIGLTGDITATISGNAAFSLDKSSLPATGDSLRVFFHQTELKRHVATLILSSGDVTVEIPVTAGGGLPLFSTDSDEYWYYIGFNRNSAGQVWTALGVDNPVKQQAKAENDYTQQWKLAGDWTTGYRIINRAGGQLGYGSEWIELKAGDSEETLGDLFLFQRQSDAGKWHLYIDGKGYPNDFGGEAGRGNETTQYRIGLYDDGAGDNGNTVIFTAAGTGTGITVPSTLEPEGTVIAVKYYTLSGVEVTRPTSKGIYIVRKTFSTGKVKAEKIIKNY